jgi:hypothetical protein
VESLIKLILPFFSTPKNYGEVLTNLAIFAFWEVYLITFVLRANPRVEAFFSQAESWGPIGKVVNIIPHHEVLNLTGALIAVAVAILTHMFQFHDRISDLLNIRQRFDCNEILIPLAKLVDSEITPVKRLTISQRREELMRAVFYRYASSTAEHPLVDRHDIEHALGAWRWFWVFVEAIFYFAIAAVVSWLLNSSSLEYIFLIVMLVLFSSRQFSAFASAITRGPKSRQ